MVRPRAATVLRSLSIPAVFLIGALFASPLLFLGLRQRKPIDPLSGFDHGPADAFEYRCRRAFDREVRLLRKVLGLNQRTGDALGGKPSLRLGAVTRCRAGQCHSGHTIGKAAREHASDRAKSRDGHAGGKRHGGLSR